MHKRHHLIIYILILFTAISFGQRRGRYGGEPSDYMDELFEKNSAAAARSYLGIPSSSGLTPTDGSIMVGDGTDWQVQTKAAIDLRDYLPTGYNDTGGTNYSTEIQAADDAAVTAGTTLKFPAGTFRIDTGIDYGGAPWIGQGKNETILNYHGSSYAVDCLGTEGSRIFVNITDMRLYGVNASAGGTGIRFGWNTRSDHALDNVEISYFPDDGILFVDENWILSFYDAYIHHNATSTANKAGINTTADATALYDISWFNLVLEGNGKVGNTTAGGINAAIAGQVQQWYFYGGTWESNIGAAECYFEGGQAHLYGVYVETLTTAVNGLDFNQGSHSIIGGQIKGSANHAGIGLRVRGAATMLIGSVTFGTNWTTGIGGEDTAKITQMGDLTDVTYSIAATAALSKRDSLVLFLSETANVNMSHGVTANQFSTDNEIITLKSTDIGHGITGETETDTYALFKKISGGDGGLQITALSDGDGTGLLLEGTIGAADPTDTIPAIILDGRKGNGVGTAALGDAETVLKIKNNNNDKWTMLGNGNLGGGVTDPDELLHLESSTSAKPLMIIENTNADTVAGGIELKKWSASAADDDLLGGLTWRGKDSAGNNVAYGYIRGYSSDITNGDRGGLITFMVQAGGTAGASGEKVLLSLGSEDVANATIPKIHFNPASIDVDYVFESDTVADALTIDGGTGVVGVGAFLAYDGTPQTLTGAGAINATTAITEYVSNGGGQALTIANGTIQGQQKQILHITDGGDGVLTGANLAGTSVTFTDDGEACTLSWSVSQTMWFVVGTNATFAP